MSQKTFTIIYTSAYGANVKHYFIEEAKKIVCHYVDESRLEEAARFFAECNPGDELLLNHEILIFCKSAKSKELTPRSFK